MTNTWTANGRLDRAGGCPSCASTQPCDAHQVPPVCVCTVPAPDGIGQCAHCLRPYKPSVPGFNACRQAWLDQLAEDAA